MQHIKQVQMLVLALLVVLASHARPQVQAKQPFPVAQPDYNIYHRKADILRLAQEVALNNPKTMKMEKRTVSEKGYSAEIMVITVEPSGLSEDHSKKARLLLDFGEHGREFITCEVGLALLQALARPEALALALRNISNNTSPRTVDSIINHVVFKILPMENEGGRALVEAGALCERKNGRGVDPNRNWLVDWGVKEKDYDPNEEFPGERAFSEPEAQLVKAIAQEFQPHVWLNVHSGMEALFTPYDHKAAVPQGSEAQVALQMLQLINHDLCAGKCVVGSGGKSVGYLAHGTATDFMYEVLRVPLSFTWEIFGDFKAHYNDCFRMFNPLQREQYQQVVDRWVASVLRLVELLPMHPALAFLRDSAQHSVLARGQEQQEQQEQQQGSDKQDSGERVDSSPEQRAQQAPYASSTGARDSGSSQLGSSSSSSGSSSGSSISTVDSGNNGSAVEELVIDVEQGGGILLGSRRQQWSAAALALLAGAIAIAAVLYMRHQGGSPSRGLPSPGSSKGWASRRRES